MRHSAGTGDVSLSTLDVPLRAERLSGGLDYVVSCLPLPTLEISRSRVLRVRLYSLQEIR